MKSISWTEANKTIHWFDAVRLYEYKHGKKFTWDDFKSKMDSVPTMLSPSAKKVVDKAVAESVTRAVVRPHNPPKPKGFDYNDPWSRNSQKEVG